MGRKSQLPSGSRNSNNMRKKQDNGPASFFKHRKEQAAQQQADPSSSTRYNKGKARQLPSANSNAFAAIDTGNDDAFESMLSDAPADFSPYAHLNQSNLHGATKDSSQRAYARHLRSLIAQSDVLIQILDARDPPGSRSIQTEGLIKAHPGKRLLFVLTKIDLVPKKVLQDWLVSLRLEHPTLAFKSTSGLSSSSRAGRSLHTKTSGSNTLETSSAATLLQLLKNYARSQPKGMSLTVGIFGQPNVGKSSLINSLVRSRACSVAPRPGETKVLQTVLLDRKVKLVDSPGVAMASNSTRHMTADELHTREVLRGTVKLELIEDPITPVTAILKRADPVKVTRLYNLPPLEGMEVEEMEEAVADPEVAKIEEDVDQPVNARTSNAAGTSAANVDFESLRDREPKDEDEDDNESEASFHRETFNEEPEPQMSSLDQAETVSTTTSAKTVAIGYDPSNTMDFLLRLALTKGKMLRGGRPDVEGAARGVINDWNCGKIAWHIAAPVAKASTLEARPATTTAAGSTLKEEVDESMSAAGASTTDATDGGDKIVSTFSEAFDLDGLFAQADAQLFGGGPPAASASAPIAIKTGISEAKRAAAEAADVTASSLGKRGREVDDEDEDAGLDSDDDASSDDDDDESVTTKRMPMNPIDAAKEATDDAMDIVKPNVGRQNKKARKSNVDEDDDLSKYLNGQQSSGKELHRTMSMTSASTGRPTGGPPKRGQRSKNKKQKASRDDDVPEYLSKLSHKASLPTNQKKINFLDGQTGDVQGLRVKSGTKGDERRRKRKLEKREREREDGAGLVVKDLEGVSLS